MKKLLIVMVSFCLIAATQSCSKSYKCTMSNGEVIEYNKVNSLTAASAKITCENSGGTWSTN